MTFTTRNQIGTSTRNHIDFRITDEKGRKVGVTIVHRVVEYVACEDQSRGGYMKAPGVYFTGYVQVTRNGQEYGASQPSRDFDTKEARDEHLAQLVCKAQARYTKKYA